VGLCLVGVESAAAGRLGQVQLGAGGEGAHGVRVDHLPIRSHHLALIDKQKMMLR
jgi:hypothetical protein